jgi:phage tail-like protein
MPLAEFDTGVGWSFGLEIDGVAIKQIQEISGLKMENDVVELKENTADGKYVNRRLLGRPKAGECTLTRGLTDDTSFDKWMNSVQFGDLVGARKGGSIIVFDNTGAEIKRYKLTDCWPKQLEIGSLKAGDTSVLTEKLTIVFDKMEPA